MPFFHSYEPQAPTSPGDQALYSTSEPGWLSGIVGEARPGTPGTDTGILAMVVMLMVLLGLNMRQIKRLFKTIAQDLWSVRRRDNAFDDHTAKESRTAIILILQLCVFEGILLYLWLGDNGPATRNVFMPVVLLSGLALGAYIFWFIAYSTIGYVFTDRVNASQWRRGFNASSIFLGISLTIPTIVSLFYPALTTAMLWLAASLYLLSRIVYIIKGFRIFYNNFPSLLYFILYLCTLEIIPLIAIYFSAVRICNYI